jgi:hypothetical protein
VRIPETGASRETRELEHSFNVMAGWFEQSPPHPRHPHPTLDRFLKVSPMKRWFTDSLSGGHAAAAEPPAEGSPSFVDDYFGAWVCWREACEDVRSAYKRWARCGAAQRGLAFASYRAALDREEQAAGVYSALTDRIRPTPVRCSP